VALALLFAFAFRNSPRRHPLVNEEEANLIEGHVAAPAAGAAAAPPRMSRREMLSRMSVRSILNLFALNLQSILSTLADNIYSSWIPLFLYEVHSLEFKEMGIYSALPLLGGAIGGALGGVLNDFFIYATGNRRWSRSLVALTGKGLAALFLLAAMLMYYDNPYNFCIMLFFVKLFGDWSLTTSWSTVTDIGGRATATVFAFNNSVAGIAAIIAPLLYGYVAQHYGWRWMFVIAGAAYVLCALSWLLINCTIPILREDTP
jgi:MFS transporter, ACS family, glucarate transporter